MLRDGLITDRACAKSPEMHTPRFSLIIPAYNEEKYLPRLLDSVDFARARYHAGVNRVEVIVADNNSTDATATLALTRACKVAQEPKRIIAAVRNAGARMAQGELLAFVDADSRIHPETFNAVEAALADEKIHAKILVRWVAIEIHFFYISAICCRYYLKFPCMLLDCTDRSALDLECGLLPGILK